MSGVARLAVPLLVAGLLLSTTPGSGPVLAAGDDQGASSPEADLRPGIAIQPGEALAAGPAAGDCTANFVFRDVGDGTVYLGTAAHCVDEASTVRLTADGDYTATVAWKGSLFSVDFALLAVDASDRDEVHPAVLHWGGPTGTADQAPAGSHLLAYGASTQRGGLEATRPLEGYATEACRGHVQARLPGSGGGDSGAPVLRDDGTAVGILVGSLTGSCGGEFRAREIRVVPIGTAIAAAEEGLGADLELATAAQSGAGRLPDTGGALVAGP